MKYLEQYELFNFGKKKKEKAILTNENEKMLKDIIDHITSLSFFSIYNKFNISIQSNAGDFEENVRTWFRRGDLLSEKESDKLITDYAGISLMYSMDDSTYEISIPIKFNSDFKNEIEEYLTDKYKVLKSNVKYLNTHTRVIKLDNKTKPVN